MIKDKESESTVAIIKAEINKELGDAETMKSLLEVTFPGFEPALMKRALLEGMMLGFPFVAFLKKDVYAIKYGNTYSLITSIDYSRKIAQKNGVWQSEPKFKDQGNSIISCTITAFRRIGQDVAEYPATVYFSEYTTGKNLWTTKPHTMIAKVAEMHALRKACPEELAKSYVEEEMQREAAVIREVPAIDLTKHEELLRSCQTLEGLEVIWADMPGDAKAALKSVMEKMKQILITEAKDIEV